MKKLENMLLQLIIGREKAEEKNMTNEKNCIEIMISNLRNDEVTLEELDYRERNGITEAREGWDDRFNRRVRKSRRIMDRDCINR